MTGRSRAADADPRRAAGSSLPESEWQDVPRWVSLAPVQLTLAGLAAALFWFFGVTAFVLLTVMVYRREHGRCTKR